MIQAACHCGAVRIELAHVPEQLTDCNCSLCHTHGTLWAYYRAAEVEIRGLTVAYLQGDKTLTSHHCQTCGCTTHWRSVDPGADRMGVNARLMPRDLLAGMTVEKLDGAHDFEILGHYTFGTLPPG